MSKTIMLAIIALRASLAFGEDRIFKFAHTGTAQQMQEIGTTIRSITDISQVSVDVAQSQISVHAAADQIGLAGWIFDRLDRPLDQQPPPTQGGAVLQYEMQASDADNEVRIFYLPYTPTVQQFAEVATAVRSTADIRRMFTYGPARAVVSRATADQTALAEWLFSVLGKPATENVTPLEYRMPGGNDDVVLALHLAHANTLQDFQEVATLVRSIADIRRLFTYNASKEIVMRGTAEQGALAEWLVSELDKTTHTSASNDYRLSNGVENDVRVFYLPDTATVQDFQRVAVYIRTTTSIRRTFTYNSPRALALRGTPTQIAQAAQLIAARAKVN